MPCDVARPQASEASVNSAIPARNSRRCPKRSPKRPPSSRKPPNDQVGVDDPRERLLREAEVFTDRGERNPDDGHVEDDHQVAEAEHEECEPTGAGVDGAHEGDMLDRGRVIDDDDRRKP
jgi:hypothetical protein